MGTRRSIRLACILFLIAATLVIPAAPAASGEPGTYEGNLTCEAANAEWETLHKADFDEGASSTGRHAGVSWSLTGSAAGQLASWSSDVPLAAVLVKGGRTGGSLYSYGADTYADSGLHTPANPSGKWADVSHLTFCIDPIEPPQPGRVIIAKVTDPAGADETFSFTSSIDGFAPRLRDGELGRTRVSPGTHSVSEVPTPGWQLDNISCGGEARVDVSTGTATFDVDPGETVRCTFTNVPNAAPEPATLTLAKVTNPADDEATFRFFGPGDWKPVLGHGETSTTEVEPGTYVLTEKFEHAWDLSSIVCDGGDPQVDLAAGTATVTVDSGEHVTCTFTNTRFCPQHGWIAIEKYTDPVDETVAFGFTSDAVSREGDAFLPTLHHGESDYVMVKPGTYSITELPVAGWALGGLTCDDPDSVIDMAGATATVTVSSSELATCVFTNVATTEPELGKLVIEKVTDPAGADATFGFTSTITGFSPVLGDGESASVLVQEGTYGVTETPTDGWELTDITCDTDDFGVDLARGALKVFVPEDGTVTCTYTNTRIPGPSTLVVEKVTVPSGTDATFPFRSSIDGFSPVLGDGQSATVEVEAGTYKVTEGATAGWRLTDISCDAEEYSVDLAGGTATVFIPTDETVTCTYTNEEIPEPEPGRIIIEKITEPSGADQTFDFSVLIGDGSTFDGALGDGESVAVEVVTPDPMFNTNIFEIGESWVEGWTLTDITCDSAEADVHLNGGDGGYVLVPVDPGETVTCTFTNSETPDLGRLVVEKVTDPAESDATFEFVTTIDGFAPELSGGELASFPVEEGSYSVTELVMDGWELTDISCTDPRATTNLAAGEVTVSIPAGETVVCTFTNTEIRTQVLGSIGDFVWNDKNRNGAQDPDEPGIPGVRINLYAAPGWEFASEAAAGSSGASVARGQGPVLVAQPTTDGLQLLATTRTDSNGNYEFTDLPGGYYVVEFTAVPSGYEFTTPFAAARAIDSDAGTDDGRTPIMTLPLGFNDITCDAGLYILQAPIGEVLPVTGTNLGLPIAAGMVLLAAGLLLLAATRPRRNTG